MDKTNVKPERIFAGPREAMVTEVAAFDPVAHDIVSADRARYLIMPDGDAMWDTDYAATKREAREMARELAQAYGVKVVWVA
jgi:hypothetical protein